MYNKNKFVLQTLFLSTCSLLRFQVYVIWNEQTNNQNKYREFYERKGVTIAHEIFKIIKKKNVEFKGNNVSTFVCVLQRPDTAQNHCNDSLFNCWLQKPLIFSFPRNLSIFIFPIYETFLYILLLCLYTITNSFEQYKIKCIKW